MSARSGVRLAPFGRVTGEEARQVFAEQIEMLCNCGVDLIIIETISDLYEIREAILAAKQVCGLPVIASMTFTRDDRTLLGDSPAKVAAEWLHEAGADVIGVNCSEGPAQVLRILRQMKAAVPEAAFSVMPNAGWPERVGGRIMYPAGPEYFGDYALAFRQAGAQIIGGCCGTTPEHIRAMRTALETTLPGDEIDLPALRVGTDRAAVTGGSSSNPIWRGSFDSRQLPDLCGDGPATRPFHPQVDRRSQPAARGRRGCDQRGRQPDGPDADESLGGL